MLLNICRNAPTVAYQCLKVEHRAMAYLRNILIAFDQFIGAFLPGSYPDETISARAYREQWAPWMGAINWLFQDENHCRDAYVSECQRRQAAPVTRE